MPRDYRLRCFENPELISSFQGCYRQTREPTPFTPSNRQTQHTFKPTPEKIIPVSQSLPFSPLPTSITPLPNNNAYHHINNLSNELRAFQNKNIPDQEDESLTSKLQTKFTYFSEDLRQQHLNFVKSFSQHADFRNVDKTAALISNAAYMEDTAVINEYLNEITNLGEQGWELSPESRASNEWIKTFVNRETGDVAIGSKGTTSWLRDDGIANITNTTGGTELRQKLNEKLEIDIRTRKARLVDETLGFIKETYGERVKILGGHSQGSFQSYYAQKNFFPNAEAISFNGAPSGVVPKHLGRNWVTPNDVVSLSGKFKALTNPNQYQVHTVKSTSDTVLNRLTGGHMIDNFTDEFAINTETTETTPLLSHTNGSSNLPNTVKSTVATNIKNIGRGVAVAGAGVASDLLVDAIAPDQPEIAKTAEKSVLGSVFMKKAASMVGAPSLLASETVIPLFTSYEVAGKTGELVDSALEDTDLTYTEKSTISGASSGVAGAATFSGTSAAVVKTGQLAKSGIQAIQAARVGSVAAEASEVVPLLTAAGEATVVGSEAAVIGTEAALIGTEAAVVGTEAAIIGTEAAVGLGAAGTGMAVGGFLAPETFGASILVGGLVGGFGGWLGGLFTQDEREREKEKQILENARQKEAWEAAEEERKLEEWKSSRNYVEGAPIVENWKQLEEHIEEVEQQKLEEWKSSRNYEEVAPFIENYEELEASINRRDRRRL